MLETVFYYLPVIMPVTAVLVGLGVIIFKIVQLLWQILR